ncbi:hypothetical protein QE152_g33628 [Popillia japonica]|uniref:Uncharacterized protein n=1 Tax=Popillia japonica TaxID=7064 RepID=A0AAW1IW29_POPJA
MPKVDRKHEKKIMKNNVSKLERELRKIYKYNSVNGTSNSIMKNNVSKLERELRKIYKYNSVNGTSNSIIPHIPVDILQDHVPCDSLKRIWDFLSYEKQCLLHEYLPCQEHYNQPWQEEHIDGPPPAKNKCYYCINNEMRL